MSLKIKQTQNKMKTLRILFLLLVTVSLTTSCSDEELDNNTESGDNTNNDPNNTVTDVIPTLNDFWKYDVVNTDNGTNESVSSTDSLYIATVTDPTYTYGINDNMIPNGTMNGLLISGELTQTSTTLTMNGALELPAEISDFMDFDINLSNVVLYNVDADNGTLLSTNSNTVQQDFNGMPVEINYELTSNALGFQETATLNGDSFTNVTSANLKLNLSISVTDNSLGFPVTINVIEPQDVFVITNHFVEGIGLVRSEAESAYEISPTALSALALANIDLGIPDAASTTNIQKLTDYLVTE